MANLTETATFDANVFQLETTTAALGGPGGVMNSQAQALANRTQYLLATINGKTAGNVSGIFASGAGAVTRTIQSKLSEPISVMDYGAIGDGTTNDAAAIVAACVAGRTVRFPAGNYRVASSMTIPLGCTIVRDRGAYFTIATGTTITMRGLVEGPKDDWCWRGSGTVTGLCYATPQHFGAKGDYGTTNTDDTAAFNAMFSAMESSALYIYQRPGYLVELLSCGYRVTGTIVMPVSDQICPRVIGTGPNIGGSRIWGSGAGTTFLVQPAVGAATAVNAQFEAFGILRDGAAAGFGLQLSQVGRSLSNIDFGINFRRIHVEGFATNVYHVNSRQITYEECGFWSNVTNTTNVLVDAENGQFSGDTIFKDCVFRFPTGTAIVGNPTADFAGTQNVWLRALPGGSVRGVSIVSGDIYGGSYGLLADAQSGGSTTISAIGSNYVDVANASGFAVGGYAYVQTATGFWGRQTVASVVGSRITFGEVFATTPVSGDLLCYGGSNIGDINLIDAQFDGTPGNTTNRNIYLTAAAGSLIDGVKASHGYFAGAARVLETAGAGAIEGINIDGAQAWYITGVPFTFGAKINRAVKINRTDFKQIGLSGAGVAAATVTILSGVTMDAFEFTGASIRSQSTTNVCSSYVATGSGNYSNFTIGPHSNNPYGTADFNGVATNLVRASNWGNKSGDTMTGAIKTTARALTDAATVTINLTSGSTASSNMFTLLATSTVGATRTLALPSGVAAGEAACVILRFTQDGVGGRALALASGITLQSGAINTAAGAASVVNLLTFDGGLSWLAIIV